MKRGRKTKLNAKLQKQLCKLLAQGHTIATVCEAVGIAERTYYDWQKHPHFSQATTRAIGESKIFLVEKLRKADDWRAQAFLLERRWPHEFGRSADRPLPPQPPSPPPDLSKSIRVTCYGAPDVDLAQFMEMKAKLEAAGVKTDFPVRDGNHEMPDHETEPPMKIDNFDTGHGDSQD